MLAVFIAIPARAENTILSSQTTSVVGEDVRVEIRFEQPMNYISHFPAKSGEQLDIKLRPILTPQIGSVIATIEDSLSPDNQPGKLLREIHYEQDEHGDGDLSVQFSQKMDFKVESSRDHRSIYITLLKAAGNKSANQNSAVPMMKLDSGLPIYVLNLETEPRPIDPNKQPILKNFRGKYDIYTIQSTQGRNTYYQLRLGYFHSLKLAKANVSRLLPFYPEAWVDTVKTDRRMLAENWFLKQNIDRLKIAGTQTTRQKQVTPAAQIPMPPVATPSLPETSQPAKRPEATVQATAPVPTVEPGVKSDKQSKLMDVAKQAMISNDYRTAISYLTHILQNPDTTYHQEAQELLGLAWERLNLPAKAVAEYRKYLTQYPTGPDAERVKQRLTGLLTARSQPVAKLATGTANASQQAPAPSWDFFGSFSQYYRNQRFETNGIPTLTIDNSFNSNLALSGRRRGTEWDQRVDFVASHRYDFLNNRNASDGNIYTLFYDVSDKQDDLSMRIGRQTHNSDGVMGRFDGVILNKRFGHNKKASFLAGFPVDNITINDSIKTQRKFYAASVKFESIIKNLDTKFYYVNQTNDGIVDRVAVGNQTQYVSNTSSMFLLADYDVHYKQLNLATFIGNWRGKDNTNYSITADYRDSPLLTTNNALIGQTTVTTLEQLRQTFTLTEVEQLAKDRTGKTKSLSASVSHPLSPQYQLNGDVTVTNMTGTPASGGVDAIPDTGNLYYYNIYLVANNFVSSNDITIMGWRYTTDITSRTASVNFSTRLNRYKNWRLNPRMSVDYRKNNDGSKRISYRPRIVIDYKAIRNWQFEMEFGYEISNNTSSTASSTDKNYYGYLGYTHDF